MWQSMYVVYDFTIIVIHFVYGLHRERERERERDTKNVSSTIAYYTEATTNKGNPNQTGGFKIKHDCITLLITSSYNYFIILLSLLFYLNNNDESYIIDLYINLNH
jgi:hypothetical protein